MVVPENFVVGSLEADMEFRSGVSLRMLESTACERKASTLRGRKSWICRVIGNGRIRTLLALLDTL